MDTDNFLKKIILKIGAFLGLVLLIKNNRKATKIIFFGIIKTSSQKCIQISKGVLIGQTVWFLWPKFQVLVFTKSNGGFGSFGGFKL